MGIVDAQFTQSLNEARARAGASCARRREYRSAGDCRTDDKASMSCVQVASAWQDPNTGAKGRHHQRCPVLILQAKLVRQFMRKHGPKVDQIRGYAATKVRRTVHEPTVTLRRGIDPDDARTRPAEIRRGQ